jgi:hypothetical protein
LLLKVFKGKYFLSLVSSIREFANPQNPQHCLVDWDELKKRVQHKRVQYQINLARWCRAHSPGARPANTARSENVGAAREPTRFSSARTPGSRPGLHYVALTGWSGVLLKVFKSKYFLCLVSSIREPANPQHCLVDWDELKKRVQHKRVQYQVNLARR